MPTTQTWPDTMLAVRVHGPGDLRVDRVPVPELAQGEVLLRVLAAGVCATDRKLLARGAPGGEVRILGHEIVGEIVHAAGSGPSLGTRVGVAPNLGDGRCPACLRGATNLCPEYRAFGVHLDGGMAEFVRIPREAVEGGHLLPIPEGLPDLEAALLEPLACCVEGLDTSDLRAGESLLVIAAGVMGRLHVAAARALGAGTIVVVDPSPERLEHARTLGADVTVRPTDDVTAAVLAATDGVGVDVAAITIGDVDAARVALGYLAREGRLNLFAGFGADQGPLEIDANDVHYRGLRVTGTTGASKATLARTLALLRGRRVPIGGMVSGVYDLPDAAAAFAAAAERRQARVVLVPGSGGGS